MEMEEFIVEKTDSWASISKETGIEIKELMENNKDSKGKSVLAEGKSVNIPEKTNIKIFKAAAAKLGDTDYSKAVENGDFAAGKNKCNLFVADMVEKKGKVPFPEHQNTGLLGPFRAIKRAIMGGKRSIATAGELGNSDARLKNTRVVSKDKAVIGDIVSYRNDFLTRNIADSATGHTMIYTGKVKILKKGIDDGIPKGGGGTIGASTDQIRYRTFDYLENEEKRKDPVFRRAGGTPRPRPGIGADHYGPAYAFP